MKDRAILIVDDLVENLQVIVSIFEQNRPDLVIYQANSGEMVLEPLKTPICAIRHPCRGSCSTMPITIMWNC